MYTLFHSPASHRLSVSGSLSLLSVYFLQPKSYEFGYSVKDDATGNDFGRRETSDGETVRGEYRVQLPDGRTQIVTYTADWRTGFHADVRYEGTATYPDQYNTQGYNAGQGFGYQGNQIGGGGGGGYTGGNAWNLFFFFLF